MFNLRRLCLFLLAAVLIVVSAPAQQTTGTIRGVLTDDSGAVIPAAAVSLSGTGLQKTAQTQADGSYTFVGLAPGEYTVKAVFPGFGPFEKAVTVNPGSTIQLPIQMAVQAEK